MLLKDFKIKCILNKEYAINNRNIFQVTVRHNWNNSVNFLNFCLGSPDLTSLNCFVVMNDKISMVNGDADSIRKILNDSVWENCMFINFIREPMECNGEICFEYNNTLYDKHVYNILDIEDFSLYSQSRAYYY
jgi:hypothetical protein